MTKDQLAKMLNGNEYGSEISKELEAEAKAAGLVAIFGYSDDNAELRGAINDEVGCYEGGIIRLSPQGLVANDCDNDDCPYFNEIKNRAVTVEALWDKEGFSWIYQTSIPHATFEIMEDGEKYCRGIVFMLADVSAI